MASELESYKVTGMWRGKYGDADRTAWTSEVMAHSEQMARNLTQNKACDFKYVHKVEIKRGELEVRQYAAAMVHQLELNKSKGDWHNVKLPEGVDMKAFANELVWDVFYHLIKLAMAIKDKEPDPIRIQEYGADVGNCSMFVVDYYKALDSVYHSSEHVVTDAEDLDQLHEFSTDIINVLKKHKVLPELWEDQQHSQGGPNGK